MKDMKIGVCQGFTLAEVLITLVIIGVIAAMTIPTLMNKTNEQETVVAVKKAYSILSQAYKKVIAENGEIIPSELGTDETTATQKFGDMIATHLNVMKNCGQVAGGDCFAPGMYKQFNGNNWTNINNQGYYKLCLNDGMFVFITTLSNYSTDGNHKVFSYAFFDINGNKDPNTLGKDVFAFKFNDSGIIPYGTPDDAPSVLLSTCRNTGFGCTAWVIYKGNQDYLRKAVSW